MAGFLAFLRSVVRQPDQTAIGGPDFGGFLPSFARWSASRTRCRGRPRSGRALRPFRARPQSREGAAVQLRVGAERDRQAEMRPGFLGPAELLEALAERVMGVVGGRVDLEEGGERFARSLVLTGVVERAPERLQDRALARLLACGPLEDDRRGRVMAPLQQVVPALQQLVGRLAVGNRIIHA